MTVDSLDEPEHDTASAPAAPKRMVGPAVARRKEFYRQQTDEYSLPMTMLVSAQSEHIWVGIASGSWHTSLQPDRIIRDATLPDLIRSIRREHVYLATQLSPPKCQAPDEPEY